MAKNDYLAKRREDRQRVFQTGLDISWQQFWDFLCIALHDPAVMGKNVYGKKRLMELKEVIEGLEKQYRPAFSLKSEADYYQEKLDAALREVYGDDVADFRNRYPDIKQLDYTKPHKGWK